MHYKLTLPSWILIIHCRNIWQIFLTKMQILCKACFLRSMRSLVLENVVQRLETVCCSGVTMSMGTKGIESSREAEILLSDCLRKTLGGRCQEHPGGADDSGTFALPAKLIARGAFCGSSVFLLLARQGASLVSAVPDCTVPQSPDLSEQAPERQIPPPSPTTPTRVGGNKKKTEPDVASG